ncbi:nuclear transport factor 2 family protein [Chiayiivirga flava]|uniref:Nuclear transport factor 2 family protein n=1 Tax=Chiayiivirga flava TaxID=659595 RepID=A0A7W8D7L3_9GAMM|nr:nuclear transport factor 2 family protein [Chiayiivirga flava]MBB5208260.1 hypothetical protein [Chiayiivirga flava]
MKDTTNRWLGATGRSVALVVLLCMLLAGCGRAPAEERLRDRFEAMRTAMLERRPGDFMDGVAEDFVGEGNADRAALHNILRAQLLRNSSLGATIGPLDIVVDGDRATMQFTMVLTGGAGGFIPERANGWSVKSGWRDGDDGWQVYFAQWEPVL